MRYSLVDIKVFVAIADEGNITKGAARCFLAPSSASLRIKQLEEGLGVSLFDRQARGVSLTRAGKVMLEHCRRVLAELEQMHANLSPYAKGIKNHVTLFANSTAIASYLPGDLEVFLREHPSVRVSLEERMSHDIVAAVADARADMGIVTWSEGHPDLRFYPYHEDTLVVIASAQVFTRKKHIRFAECLDHPFVSLGNGTAIHTYLVGRAAALGRQLDVRIQVAGFPAVAALVRSAAGISIIPRSVLSALNHDGIRVVELQEAWAERHLQVCVRRDEALLSVHAVDLLRQFCGEHPVPH